MKIKLNGNVESKGSNEIGYAKRKVALGAKML